MNKKEIESFNQSFFENITAYYSRYGSFEMFAVM